MFQVRNAAMLLAGALSLVAATTADAKMARSGTPSVTFTATGPGGMRIVGKTSELDVKDDGAAITVAVPLANVGTGITLRDKHMRDRYLQAQTYPTAELSVARNALPLTAGKASEGTAKGTVRMHGKTKEVSFHYAIEPSGGALSVKGSVQLNMNDYGIEIPSWLGVTVRPAVDIDVSFTAKDE